MRLNKSEVEVSEVMVRANIEMDLGEELDEWDGKHELDLYTMIESPGPHGAEFGLLANEDLVNVTVWMYLADLLALPGRRSSPTPRRTELGDHGKTYETYRNHIIWAVTTELGLRPGITHEDAIYGMDERAVLQDQSEDVVGLVCEDYEGVNNMFGPDLTKRVPFSVGFQSDAFWELDELTEYSD